MSCSSCVKIPLTKTRERRVQGGGVVTCSVGLAWAAAREAKIGRLMMRRRQVAGRVGSAAGGVPIKVTRAPRYPPSSPRDSTQRHLHTTTASRMAQRPAKASKAAEATPRDELSEGSSSESDGAGAEGKGKGKKKMPKRSSKACKHDRGDASMSFVADAIYGCRRQVSTYSTLASWAGGVLPRSQGRPYCRTTRRLFSPTEPATNSGTLFTAVASLSAGACGTRTRTGRRLLFATIGKPTPPSRSLACRPNLRFRDHYAQRRHRSRMHKSGRDQEAVSLECANRAPSGELSGLIGRSQRSAEGIH